MKIIYCISGLGADERAFSKLNIEAYQLKVIQWLQPLPKETIEEYATRMRAEINEENPVLMGLSFGGMLCIEISKQIPVQKIIIISSVKSYQELPLWMKAVGHLKLNKIAPIRSNHKLSLSLQNHFLGITTKEEKEIVAVSRKKHNTKYVQWAVDKVVNWKNNWQHPAIFHIHGDKDRMFPVKRIKPTYTIKNGGHFMIMNRAAEVSVFINQSLNS